MLKKMLLMIVSLFTAAALLAGCNVTTTTPQNETKESLTAEKDSSREEAPIKVALVHTLTGVGDKSMNDMALKGLQMAETEFGISFTNVEPKENSEFETMLMQLASTEEYDLIFSLSTDQSDALNKVAPLFPEQKFSAISYECDQPNVSSITSIWNEFCFAAGYLASAVTTCDEMSKTNAQSTIGFIYAMDIPAQIEPAVGFIAGAKLANPDADVLTGVVGNFQDINKAKEIAIQQYGKGADVIQCFAGKAGMGVINAAQEKDQYVFGIGTNQNGEAPDNVVCSTINAINMPMLQEIRDLCEGKWEPGIKEFGLAEMAYELTFEGSNVVVPQTIVDGMNEAVQKVVDGEIVLPSTFEELDSWISENIK